MSVYKRQIYPIAESNRKKIDSVARIESKLFLHELECCTERKFSLEARLDSVPTAAMRLQTTLYTG